MSNLLCVWGGAGGLGKGTETLPANDLGTEKDVEMEQKAPCTLDLHQGNRMPSGVCVS